MAYSQNNAVRGIITEAQTGGVLDMATIALQPLPDGNIQGTTSNMNGFYQINNVVPGEYLFMVRYVGFETYRDTINVSQDTGILSINVRLNPASEELDEVTVSDRTIGDMRPGQRRIRPENFRRAPTPAGSADLVSYLQTQPGVLVTGDRGGQLFVRGGMPSENLVLMDGTLIYQPFHIVGFFSVFPEDVVSSADFYAGGFGPRYSGRSSSVMDVRLKNGNLYEPGWSASVSPFISDLFFETPITNGKSSLLVSLRGSLIEESSKHYLGETQPLRFNSQLIKYNSTSNTGLSCSALLMRTYDRGQLDFESNEYFKWSNFVTGGRCAGASEESSLAFMEINFGLSYFSNETAGAGSGRRTSNIFKSHLDVNLTQYIRNWRLDYGFFTNYKTLNYDLLNRFVSLNDKEDSFLSTGGYMNVHIPIGSRFSLDPGVSVTSYMNRLPASVEPRLQFSWHPRGQADEQIHGALGIYRQPIIGLTDFRDAGTAFTAWMMAPDSGRRLETLHILLGWRQPISPYFDFSVEGYYKDIKDTPVAVWSTIAEFTTDLAYADGTVQGVDVRLNFNRRNFYAGVGYGYAITEYQTAQDHFGLWFGEPVQRYNPPHDRRHQLNAQTGIDVGNFSANISWLYGSGMPFTRPMGFDSFFSFRLRPPAVTRDFGDPRILLDKPFQGRLPVFHRLDVSVEQLFELSAIDLRVQLGAINIYDQSNLFYYDVFYQRGIYQLPMVPYLAIKMQSK